MRLRKRELARARAELRAAALWYEDKRAGLGLEFFDAVDAAVEAVIDFPDAWAPYEDWEGEPAFRAKRVVGYPYRIVYLVDGEEIVVFAYPHDKQRPGYWLDRVSR